MIDDLRDKKSIYLSANLEKSPGIGNTNLEKGQPEADITFQLTATTLSIIHRNKHNSDNIKYQEHENKQYQHPH